MNAKNTAIGMNESPREVKGVTDMPPHSPKVFVRYSGRLGNQLFRFAAGWVLAQRSGFSLCADPIRGFPGTRGFSAERTCVDPMRTRGQVINLDACEQSLRLGRDVLIDGWHQRYEILRPMKLGIKSVLSQMEGPAPEQMPASDDLVATVRLGDYFTPDHVRVFGYPLEDVLKVIRSQRFGRLWYLTDEPDHPFIRQLECEFKAAPGARNVLQQFAFIKSATRLIITPSTFSWWAAWLSRAEEIYFPHEKGCWRQAVGRIKLWVNDEPRYVAY